MIAAAAMRLASVSVIGTALRLRASASEARFASRTGGFAYRIAGRGGAP